MGIPELAAVDPGTGSPGDEKRIDESPNRWVPRISGSCALWSSMAGSMAETVKRCQLAVIPIASLSLFLL
jgi:hypothetical protein